MLLRRNHDFVSFLSSLARDRERPDLSHFEGTDGVVSAYRKLLTLGAKELLSFLPIVYKEEEHPLCDFYRRYVRERQAQRILLRIIINDTTLGRRYKSRDPFEYRSTTLLPEYLATIPLERIIAGDVVACFDIPGQRACFIRYPQLAQAERTVFLSLMKLHEILPPLSQTT